MLTKSTADKPYPEQEECLENTRICSFDVEYICHECGKPLCPDCAVGIRHQPRLVKFWRTDRQGQQDRTEWHCQEPECLQPHHVTTKKMAAGLGGVVLGLLILYAVGGSFLPLTLIALLGIIAGGYLVYTEWQLKDPQNEEMSFLSMWPDFPV